MTDMKDYFHEQTKVEAARLDTERASARLELAKIKCRLAEIKSQAEPLDTIWPCSSGDNKDSRKRTYDAAFYVVIGRMP